MNLTLIGMPGVGKSTYGKTVAMKEIHEFIDSLKIPDHVKTELKQLTPHNYTGLAAKLVDYEE